MSKPLDTRLVINQKGALAQVLALLEQARAGGRMVRISSELSNILADERNLRKVQSAKNLDELLDILEGFETKKMLRVPCNELLKLSYPALAKSSFF